MVSRLTGWSAFITKVTFCNSVGSSKRLPEFKAKQKEIHDAEGAFVPRITIQRKTWRYMFCYSRHRSDILIDPKPPNYEEIRIVFSMHLRCAGVYRFLSARGNDSYGRT
jgi:hypothetical protein